MGGKKPVLLVIVDGWGLGKDEPSNAVKAANTPFIENLFAGNPWVPVKTSGEDVGLPKGQMGNSEVGHLNIGAGRIVYQSLSLIYREIEQGTFFTNKELTGLCQKVRDANGALHLMGLVSDGGVHSHIDHLVALLKLAKEQEIKRVYVHAFLDGRDTAPKSAPEFIQQLEAAQADLETGKIATVSGRFYAMDRDKRWDRIQAAYDAMLNGRAEFTATSAREAVEAAYARGETDEFVKPTIITNERKNAVGQINDRDGVIFFNFRADRAREMSRALTDAQFQEFERGRVPKLSGYVCFTEYDATLKLPFAFTNEEPKNTLGEVISKAKLTQLRAAETEKYAHVTYFFSGGQEKVFEGEDRILVPSPKDVKTYDLKPEMSAAELTGRVIEAIGKKTYDFIALNYANSDQVGHTGIFEAAVKANEAVDQCLARLVPAAQEKGYTVLVTADHGNSEQMADAAGKPYTQHTTNPVAFILVEPKPDGKRELRQGGRLSDIAPTILDIMGIKEPPEMTGQSLIEHHE
ncbi:MAG: 2,3-bisphosphoglycerate-independent phosphoglycerate mutase [Deltaproteobacteria bacterium]|nr:2,3-bisphosphoglycerate-independent phosphoglycerate mutase [Deltaproteobacteria bacterium]